MPVLQKRPKVKCSHCGKVTLGRIPKHGDGTLLTPTLHKSHDGKRCIGSYFGAEEQDDEVLKLSSTQLGVLECAFVKLDADERQAHRGLCSHPGWFTPRTKSETADVLCHPNTAKALCSLGLMDYRTHGEPYRYKGKWHQDIEYRISEAGIKFIKPGQQQATAQADTEISAAEPTHLEKQSTKEIPMPDQNLTFLELLEDYVIKIRNYGYRDLPVPEHLPERRALVAYVEKLESIAFRTPIEISPNSDQ